MVLQTSLPKGICYIETKNLDGETNLKHKQADKRILEKCGGKELNVVELKRNLGAFSEIICEKENDSIYTFQGNFKFGRPDGTFVDEVEENEIPIEVDQVLMRGSSLRNTQWIIGVAVYTGHDTKVMMNSSSSRSKLSKVDKSVNHYVIVGVVVQMVVCLLSGIGGGIYSILELSPDKSA